VASPGPIFRGAQALSARVLQSGTRGIPKPPASRDWVASDLAGSFSCELRPTNWDEDAQLVGLKPGRLGFLTEADYQVQADFRLVVQVVG
jgi:hypothetical protein